MSFEENYGRVTRRLGPIFLVFLLLLFIAVLIRSQVRAASAEPVAASHPAGRNP